MISSVVLAKCRYHKNFVISAKAGIQCLYPLNVDGFPLSRE